MKIFNSTGPPVEVGVTMHIISISSISAVQMVNLLIHIHIVLVQLILIKLVFSEQDFTSDFYFRQAWRDSRLAFTPHPGIEALYVGSEVSDKIWVPDTFFANEKSAQFHMATTPNTFIRIRSNGEVLRSIRFVSLILFAKGYICVHFKSIFGFIYIQLQLSKS